MRTKIVIYGAWLFAVLALFAHIAAVVSLLTRQLVFGLDPSAWILFSMSEALIAIIGYLDHFAHKGGALTGQRNE